MFLLVELNLLSEAQALIAFWKPASVFSPLLPLTQCKKLDLGDQGVIRTGARLRAS